MEKILINDDEHKVKKAREALLESEAKYSDMVEHANDGIVIVQDGVVPVEAISIGAFVSMPAIIKTKSISLRYIDYPLQ